MKPHAKILVADDDPINVAIMEEILSADHELALTTSGEEAIEAAARFKPDLVLTDIMMPGIDGYEVCRRLRASPALQYTKIILVSAKAMTSERLKGYDAGADDYLTKPFEEAELKAKVKVFLRLKSVEELDKLKTDVLSLLAHEVRTPLNAVLPLAELLLAGQELSPAERDSYVRAIAEGAMALHTLFSKALLLCSFRAGKAALEKKPLDVRALVARAVSEVQAHRPASRIEIRAGEPAERCVEGDASHLEAAVSAVIDNAVRFSAAGQQVGVEVEQDGASIRIRVTDRGPGIDPSVMPQLFEGLAVGEIREHTAGHGLSLALSRAILRAHGGDIEARSHPEGGSVFTISIPAAVSSQLAASGRRDARN